MAACRGLHCRCMNLDGRCPNPHHGDHDCPYEDQEARVAVDPKAAPKPAEPPKAPEPQSSTWWRMTYPYALLYLLPGRISRYVQPGEVIDWGQDGPPDGHWEPADPPPEPEKE